MRRASWCCMSNYRNPLLFQARKIAAARELMRGGNRSFTGTFSSLGNIGCGCQVNYTGGGMKGYREALLNGVHKTGLRGLAQSRPEGTPALIPVSDRKAVDAAVRLFKGLKP